jgi:hypothetical protein
MAGSETHVVDSVTNFMNNKRYHKHVGIINFQESSEHIPETSRSHHIMQGLDKRDNTL